MMTAMKNLEIEFHQGLLYQYSGIPTKPRTSHKFKRVGKYFSDKVRNRFRAKLVTVNLPFIFFFCPIITALH